jgi:HAD superfamily hydrolase (TIGR01509 family)
MSRMKALIFDQDGVIADTERDGHRVAFNRVFEEEGLGVCWSVERYGELLKIAGGKERMKTVVDSDQFTKDVGDKEAYLRKLHKRKTDLFMEIVTRGELALRAGIRRLVREARGAGLKLAVCSTSNERAVHTLVRTLLGEEAYGWFDVILAGDVVGAKKPSPEIYHLVAERLDLPPHDCLVIEDSRNGLLAAKGAGMRCVITQNAYTAAEDFREADLVLDCLGDPGGETARVIAARVDLGPLEFVTLDHLGKLFA